jgi:hypothetical protein
MWVLEGYTDKLLQWDLVEPVCERPVRAPEALAVFVDRLLVVLVVVGRSRASKMGKVRQGVLTTTFARVDRR